MRPKFSAYLDIVRFLAALTVFLGHASGKNWTHGFLWRLGEYGDTCVVVFFLLSGFVIAYVTDNKEGEWWAYGANRIARLWSVVIPALALTFVIDYFGVRAAPELYLGQPWFSGDHLGMRYLASFFLVHEAWHLDYVPGINQPFWSLSYEAFYYLIFGLLTFCKGRMKMLALLAVFILGGPLVLILFPIWFAGVFAYRKSKVWAISRSTAMALFAIGSAMVVLSPTIRQFVSWRFMGQEITGRYVDAIAFFLNLMAAHRLFDGKTALPPIVGTAIKRIASTTFVLYLFHRPLIQLFSYIGPADPASWERRALVIGATLAIVALFTPMCDGLQKYLRTLWLDWLTPRQARPPATRTRLPDETILPPSEARETASQ